MVNVDEIRKAQRAEGPATVMAIGTETPPNFVDQSADPDYYFRVTNSEHKTLLKEKFKRMLITAVTFRDVEGPLFELVWIAQTILPDSEGAIDGHLREVGLTFHLFKDVPGPISKNIEMVLVEAFKPLGISDYDSIFWIAYPGGPTILDQVEDKLGLKSEKLEATRFLVSK